MSRPARLAVLLAALALSGCASAVTPHPAPAQVALPAGAGSSPAVSAASSAPTTSAAAQHVCTGLAGCHPVSSVDVDGDGLADQVGIAAHRVQHGGSVTVRVLTATGHALQTTGSHVFWFSDPYLGATHLDGRRGAELVLGDTMGAHTQQARVVTYRSGRLVTLPEPPVAWTSAGLAESTDRWTVDGSWSSDLGVVRTSSADAGVRLTLSSAVRNDSGTGHTGHTTVYRWRSGHWQQVSTREVHYPADADAAAVGGWHVPGLSRFTG